MSQKQHINRIIQHPIRKHTNTHESFYNHFDVIDRVPFERLISVFSAISVYLNEWVVFFYIIVNEKPKRRL